MKKRILGLIIATWCISSLVMTSAPVKVYAASGTTSGGDVTLNTSNSLEIPQDGIINAEIQPGATVNQVFKINNKSSQPVDMYISGNMEVTDAQGNPIKVEAGKTFNKDLVRKLAMVIKDQNNKLIYQGPCSGDEADATEEFKTKYKIADITSGLFRKGDSKGIGLGTIGAGDAITLSVSVTMDGDSFGNEYQNLYSLFNWKFYCQGSDPYNPPYNPPTPDPTPDPEDPVTPIPDPEVPGDDPEIPEEPTDPENPVIEDPDVPTTDIEIEDEDVPESGDATLAHTGFKVVYFKEAAIILVVLLGAFGAVTLLEKKKKKENQ